MNKQFMKNNFLKDGAWSEDKYAGGHSDLGSGSDFGDDQNWKHRTACCTAAKTNLLSIVWLAGTTEVGW